MSKRGRPTLLEEHQEWVDHMYNPPYWINRISLPVKSGWRFARRHPRLSGLSGMVMFGMALWTSWPAPWDWAAMPAVGMLGLLFVVHVILFFQVPEGQSASKQAVRKSRASKRRRP